MSLKQQLLALIGNIAKDGSPFKNRQRIHQGWWRTAVLGEPEGQHPKTKDEVSASTIPLDIDSRNSKNFLTAQAYEDTKQVTELFKLSKSLGSGGIIQEDRLYGNLLSSQPLAFNFWATVRHHPDLANALLPQFIPDFQSFIDIQYEWSPQPKQNYTNDNSAFDVLIVYYNRQNQKAYLGLEVKYTDTFSAKVYDTPIYEAIYKSNPARFRMPYDYYVQSSYNQLFRNELLACAIENKDDIPVMSGLFYHGDDVSAITVANTFANALTVPFVLISYQAFIAAVQKLDISWELRQWSMMLWARYAGLGLSEVVYNEYRLQS